MNEGENLPDQKVLCSLRATRCSSRKANLTTPSSVILLLNRSENLLFKAQTLLNQLIYLWMFTLYRKLWE